MKKTELEAENKFLFDCLERCVTCLDHEMEVRKIMIKVLKQQKKTIEDLCKKLEAK